MERLGKQVMLCLSQTSPSLTPDLWWKLMTLLTWGSGAEWVGQDTVSLLKIHREIEASKGFSTSRQGFASKWKLLELAQQEQQTFWGVLKDRSKGSHANECLPRIISLAGNQNLSVLSSVHFEAACLIPIISGQYHICHISEIPGLKVQCMHCTEIRVKRICIQIKFNAFCLLRDWSFLKDHTR